MAHLTIEDRIEIEQMLKAKQSLNKIAMEVDKACSTISREILKHYVESDKVHYHRLPNCCIHRWDCNKTYVCSKHYRKCKKIKCSTCKECNEYCSDFVEEKCSKLMLPPYVCNSCNEERKCTLHKRFYIPSVAHKEYRKVLVEAREGVNLTEAEHMYLDELFSPLLVNGQSIYHIWASHKNKMIRSIRSIYRYVDGSLFSARNIDMPRVVKMKPRKTKPVQFKVDKLCHINRTMVEFEKYLSENPGVQVVEMDSVEGVKGGKVLLTLHFVGMCDFMLAFIRNHNTAQTVIDIFDHLYEVLGAELFRKLFKCLLGDRGSEFTNPKALETAPDGTERCRVFFCNPQASWEKPHVESNHRFIRRVLPKGTSFDHLQQEDIDKMMNNVNSYLREKLNNRCPAVLLRSLFGQEVLDKLNVEIIQPDEINLTPNLLKK